jgi:hypothetical protein
MIIQNPTCKLETAVQLIGEHGIGKNVFTNVLCTLLGSYAEENICDIEHLTGTFNDIIENKKLLILNEIAAVDGDKYRYKNKTKTIITEKKISINKKFLPIRTILNVANIISISNHYICLILESGDRRWFVLLVSDKYQQDKVYFEKLTKQCNNEFYSNLLTYFMTRDLKGFQHRDIPMTIEKQTMIDASKGPYETFVDKRFEDIVDVTGPELRELFDQFLRDYKYSNFTPPNRKNFVEFMKKFTGEAKSKRINGEVKKVYNIKPKLLEKLQNDRKKELKKMEEDLAITEAEKLKFMEEKLKAMEEEKLRMLEEIERIKKGGEVKIELHDLKEEPRNILTDVKIACGIDDKEHDIQFSWDSD